MSILIASDQFIVRHFLGEALNWEYGVCTYGDYTDTTPPFHLHFEVLIVSLNLKYFSAWDVARYYKKKCPGIQMIGMYPPDEEVMIYPGVFDTICEEPHGHRDAHEIVKGIKTNDRRVVNF